MVNRAMIHQGKHINHVCSVRFWLLSGHILGFEVWILVLIASVPDLCILFHF